MWVPPSSKRETSCKTSRRTINSLNEKKAHEHSQGTESLKESTTQSMRHGIHWIRNESRATRLTVKEQPTLKVTGWLTNSRCIADELETFQCGHQTQPKHCCQDELVLAILTGLRKQLQVDGKMEVCSFGPHFTGHGGEPIDEEEMAKFYDDVTGKWLPGRSEQHAKKKASS